MNEANYLPTHGGGPGRGSCLVGEGLYSFIRRHLNDDVRKLALSKVSDPNVDLRAAVEQIAGHQAARRKLPLWAATDGIVYPPHLSMEQCSSEKTARYKASVARRLTESTPAGPQGTLTDLTGGFGVDFSFMVSSFKRGIYVERNEELCRIAEHNFKVLGLNQAEVINTDAGNYLRTCAAADMIFIDPARRDRSGRRTFAISDCTPDVLALKALLLDKAPAVMLKLSPMLDWRKAVSDFGGAVSEVHIVASDGECKELLLVLNRKNNTHVRVFCVNDDNVLEFDTVENAPSAPASDVTEMLSSFTPQGPAAAGGAPLFISEPDAAVMKAGFFSELERRFNVCRIGVNSNLFLSRGRPKGFPGRVFAVRAVSTMNRRELKTFLAGTVRTNITVRNFPLSVAELRRRLRLKDGGECYIFATTAHEGRHVLVMGIKN